MGKLPNPLIADISAIIARAYTGSQLNDLFIRLGEPGDSPTGDKKARVRIWLQHANDDSAIDQLAALGRLLEELMDRSFPYGDRLGVDRIRSDVTGALERAGFAYRRGGMIVDVKLSGPSTSLESLIRQQKLDQIEIEFDRASRNVQSDPPAAITAACAILEALFKVIIADDGLMLPSEQTVLPLWKPVQAHLGLDPKSQSASDDRMILQGLVTTIHGIAGRRTKSSSAHGHASGVPVVEERHARLAVNAAHTVVMFVMNTRKARVIPTPP